MKDNVCIPCNHGDHNSQVGKIETSSFDLLKYIDGTINYNLLKIGEMEIDQDVDIDSPPDVSRRIVETNNNSTNEYYTHFNNKNDQIETPWKDHPYYFRNVHISILAMLKMTTHAMSGGSIEIMGMLVGFHRGNDMIILDCYPLPVQGTESRVNPQNDSYEFMLGYLSNLQKSKMRKENILGWYHSHPGFGCWLSGIDVQTQKLHQGFEDPYVAIVVDPIKSIKNGIVDIGAFRTINDNHKPRSKISESNLGWHSKEYYSLNINVFINDHDRIILNHLKGGNSYLSLCDVQGTHEATAEIDTNIAFDDDSNNNNNNTDYDAIKIWRRINSILSQISTKPFPPSCTTKKENPEFSVHSILDDSGDFKISSNNDDDDDSGFRTQNLFTSKKPETPEKFSADTIRLSLAKAGVEMDMVSSEEAKRYLLKQIQRNLFQ